jgi:hypothetical protein
MRNTITKKLSNIPGLKTTRQPGLEFVSMGPTVSTGEYFGKHGWNISVNRHFLVNRAVF